MTVNLGAEPAVRIGKHGSEAVATTVTWPHENPPSFAWPRPVISQRVEPAPGGRHVRALLAVGSVNAQGASRRRGYGVESVSFPGWVRIHGGL
jgi:hypothetical protein